MILGATDFEAQLFRPAVDGTVNLLEAIKKSNANVSRAVITSSIASILDPLQGQRPGYVYTEKDWNPVSKEAAIESGNAVLAYLASKTISEKAAFDYVEKNKVHSMLQKITPDSISPTNTPQPAQIHSLGIVPSIHLRSSSAPCRESQGVEHFFQRYLPPLQRIRKRSSTYRLLFLRRRSRS